MTHGTTTLRPALAACALRSAILALATAAILGCDGREPPASVTMDILDATTVWCSGYDMGARINIDVANRSGQSIRPVHVTVETGPDPDTGEGEASAVVDFVSSTSISDGAAATVVCGSGSGWYGEPSTDTDMLPLRLTARFERLPGGEQFDVEAVGTLHVEHWYDSCYSYGTNTCRVE